MNPSLALPSSAGNIGVGELLAFAGLRPVQSAPKRLAPTTNELVRTLSEIRSDILHDVIGGCTAEDFADRRKNALGEYVSVMRAWAELSRVVVPDVLRSALADESFLALDAELEAEALPRFGSAIKDQALFTTWTIRRTITLLQKIGDAGDPQPGCVTDDERNAKEFSASMWWAQFHMDCLLAAIRFDKPLRPDVLAEIADGLRAVVNAYAAARRGLTFRSSPVSVPAEESTVDWDSEDEELLAASMRDLDHDQAIHDERQAG